MNRRAVTDKAWLNLSPPHSTEHYERDRLCHVEREPLKLVVLKWAMINLSIWFQCAYSKLG